MQTKLSLPASVTIMDVSPRDGLQAIETFIPTEKKIELIDTLVSTGLRRIEAASFVSPQWVPQMADADAVLQAIAAKHPDIYFEVLIPNEKGYARARATKLLKHAGFVIGATESFNTKNVNMSIGDSLSQFAMIAHNAKVDGVRIRGTISVAFVCPYEGRVPREKTIALADMYFQLGADEVCLADTIGRAAPNHVYDVAAAIKDRHPDKALAGHFHDTFGHSLANIFASMQAGVDIFDASAGNLGGCPFAKGATGNVATERVVHMLSGMGIETGINLQKMIEAGKTARAIAENRA